MQTFKNEGPCAKVRAFEESPLVPDEVSIRGFVYDVKSGKLTEVN